MNELINQARELCDAATPGPWKNPWDSDAENKNAIESPDGEAVVSAIWVDGPQLVVSVHNAAFIAASRTLVPQLCDALEAAEKEIEQLNIVLQNERKEHAKEYKRLRSTYLQEAATLTARAEKAEAERDACKVGMRLHNDNLCETCKVENCGMRSNPPLSRTTICFKYEWRGVKGE